LLASIEANGLQPMTGTEGIAPERIQDAQNHLLSQWRDYDAKCRRLDGEIGRYTKQLPLISQRAKDYKALAKDHDVSVHAWLEKEQDKAEVEGKLVDAMRQRDALIAETRKNAEDQLNEGLKFAASSDQDAQRAIAHSDLLKLTAPVDGTVQQLTVHTIGGVVQAAQPLMVIVPAQHQVEIEAFVENKDIGFIHEGQAAEVKVETFDYTKYGTVKGKVSHVSRDAIDPSNTAAIDALQNKDKQKKDQEKPKGAVYSVKILLDRKSMNIDGREVLLTPGMSASIEVKTGSRRIIEYFLSPLIQHSRESLNER
jgi:hemolysin D